MNQLQQEDLNILNWVTKECDQHGINYILDSGTFLGAVRHKGFIPWDDDVDIAMLREEYSKFEDVMVNKLIDKSGYRYQSRMIDKYYVNEFAKVRSDKIDVREVVSKTQKGFNGAWIDVFPFDNVPDDKNLRLKQFNKVDKLNRMINLQLLVQLTKKDKGIRKVIKSTIQFINEKTYKLNPLLPLLFKLRLKEMTKYNDQNTKAVANFTYPFYKSYKDFSSTITPRESFLEVSMYEFETDQFKGPKDYDRYLSNLYGDYMTLPDAKERKVHRIE